MGLPSIQEKLQTVFSKDSFEEAHIVYILSRIRKIIEADGKRAKYGKLKFYCDWALHSKIDDIELFREELEEFLALDQKNLSGLLFVEFRKQFEEFLNEYCLSTKIFSSAESTNNFFELLVGIYEDTPLIIKVVKRRIEFKKQSIDDNGLIVKYEITDIL